MSMGPPPRGKLLRRAERRFGPLAPAERQLIVAAQKGQEADFGTAAAPVGTPAGGPRVRSSLLRWLIVDRDAQAAVDPKGLRLRHAELEGLLDLDSVRCPWPLWLRDCWLPDGMEARLAQLPYLNLSGSRLRHLRADRLRCDSTVTLMDGFVCDAGVSLQAARIAGNLNASGARLAAARRDGRALDLTGADIGGALVLDGGFRSVGQVRFYGGSVGGNIEIQGARLAARGEPALVVESVRVGRNLYVRGVPQGPPDRALRVLGGVRLLGSQVEGQLSMRGARIRSRRRPALDATALRVTGSAFLLDLDTRGEVVLMRAAVGGVLNASRARIVGESEGRAVELEGAQIGGSLLLADGFRALGQVRMLGGRVGAAIECGGGSFAARGGPALMFEDVGVAGPVLMRRGAQAPFRALGGVRVFGCTIGGDLDLNGAIVRSSRSPAIEATNLKLSGSLRLIDAWVRGRFVLGKAQIGRMLEASGATLVDPEGEVALIAEGTTIGLAVLIRHGARCIGSVRFFSASIGSTVDFNAARFAVRGGARSRRYALDLLDTRIGGSLLMSRTGAEGPRRSFRAVGGVRLAGVSVAGEVECSGALLRSRNLDALNASRLTVGRSLQLGGGTRIAGEVDLSRCSVADHLDLGGLDNGPGGLTGLDIGAARVGGTLFLREGLRLEGPLSLRGTSLGRLDDEEAAWPTTGSPVDLEGLTYQGLQGGDIAMRLRWLARHAGSAGGDRRTFVAQPYEQLIQVLKRNGHEADARKVAIAKEVALRDSGTLPRWAWARHWLYGATMRFGYQPQWSLWYAPLFIAGLVATFQLGADDLMLPAKDDARKQWAAQPPQLPAGYPSFSTVVYAIDAFVPIVQLQQKDNWQVNDRAWCKAGPERCGTWLRRYLWLHSVVGWIITTLAVAGFTGLVRKS